MSFIRTIEEIEATWNENLNKKTMKLKKYRIDDIADLNRSCISKNDKISDIEYLDTSNITENVIFDTYMLNIDNAPSRAQRKVSDKTILYSTVRPRLKHYGILNSPKDNFIVSTGFVTIDIKEPQLYTLFHLIY